MGEGGVGVVPGKALSRLAAEPEECGRWMESPPHHSLPHSRHTAGSLSAARGTADRRSKDHRRKSSSALQQFISSHLCMAC